MTEIRTSKPKAIVFAAHPWSGVPYGLHHIARALARLGWQVLYVEPYFSPLHLAGGRRRGRVFGRQPRTTEEPGVSVVSPFTILPHANLPILRSSAALHLSNWLSWPRVGARSLAESAFANPDLVLCGSSTANQVALSLGAGMSVYRLADDSRLFDVVTLAARRNEIEGLCRFDAVIATSTALVARAQQLDAARVLLVPNGVDRRLFEGQSSAPATMTDLPKPRILYAGAVEDWFDWELLSRAARERPGYSFVIVGSIRSHPPADLPGNIHLVGQRAYSEMPAFMQAVSVGIVPFASKQHSEAIRAINPLKLYEYLASGLPVVSSIPSPNLSCEGLFIYDGREDFLRRLDEAVLLRARDAVIRAPANVDWANIVVQMLVELGLPLPAQGIA